MEFKLLVKSLYEAYQVIPTNAKIVVDFSACNKIINEDNLQVVTALKYTKETNTLGLIFEEELTPKDIKRLNYKFNASSNYKEKRFIYD